MKKNQLIICFLLLWIGLSMQAQRLDWKRIGRPHAAKMITIDPVNEKLYAMNEDGSVYMNHGYGQDNTWKRVGWIPRDSRSFRVLNGVLYYLSYNRYLYKGRLGNQSSIRSQGRVYLADQFDIALGRRQYLEAVSIAVGGVIKAKNYPKSGADSQQWKMVGKYRSAEKLITAGNGFFVLTKDKQLLLNEKKGQNGQWELIDKPWAAAEITAIYNFQTKKYRLYALNKDKSLWVAEYKRKHQPKTALKTRALLVQMQVGQDDINKSIVEVKVQTDDRLWHRCVMAKGQVVRANAVKKGYLFFKSGKTYSAQQVKRIEIRYQAAQTDIFGARDQSDLKFRVSTHHSNPAKNVDVLRSRMKRYHQYDKLLVAYN